MGMPKNWKIERLDPRTLQVEDPCVSTPVEVSMLSQDRRVRSFYNLLVDISAQTPAEGDVDALLADWLEASGNAFTQLGATVSGVRLEDLRQLIRAARANVQPKGADDLLACEIAPRPLSYSLHDYHRAGLDGPLHAQWQDKPHRLLYGLIAAVRYYATTQAPAVAPEVAELVAAAERARDVLAELYAKYQTKIGPFASQAQLANVELGAALKALHKPPVQDKQP